MYDYVISQVKLICLIYDTNSMKLANCQICVISANYVLNSKKEIKKNVT